MRRLERMRKAVCGVGSEHNESRQAGPPIVASVPRIRPVSDAAADDAALDACGAVETVDVPKQPAVIARMRSAVARPAVRRI